MFEVDLRRSSVYPSSSAATFRAVLCSASDDNRSLQVVIAELMEKLGVARRKKSVQRTVKSITMLLEQIV